MRYFEWDPEKARTNLRNHGISFEDAMEVFDDPDCLSFVERFVDEEERWHTVGMTKTQVFVVQISHLLSESEDGEDELIRMISARKATPLERERYEQNG